MDGIKSWVFSFCCAASAGALLSLLAPDSPLGKVFRFSVRVFLLCTLVLPIGRWGELSLSVPVSSGNVEQRGAALQRQLLGELEVNLDTALEQRVSDMLREKGVEAEKIRTVVHTLSGDGIAIDCIRVTPVLPGQSPEQWEQALAQVGESLGIALELDANAGGLSWP